MLRRLLLVALLALLAGTVVAQTSRGQFCVRTYEDRNGNGQRDPGEPPFTSGVSVELTNADGVIIASQLLQNSPTAASGVVCFQQLAPGQYTVTANTADFEPTTDNSRTATIGDTSVEVFDFGARRIVSEPTSAPASSGGEQSQRAFLQRIFVAGMGAAVVTGAMIVIGVILYFIFFYRRGSTPRRTTGSMPAVETGTHNAVDIDDFPPFEEPEVNPDDDTSRFRPPPAE